MPQILETTHALQEHCMAQMEVGGCGIKPSLNSKRLPISSRLFEAVSQALFAVQTDTATAQFSDLLSKAGQNYIAVSLMRVSRTTCTRTSPMVSACSSMRRAKR